MQVRRATVADDAALVRMAVNAYAESAERGAKVPDVQTIRERLRRLRGHFLRIVTVDDEPVGVIAAIVERHAIFDHAIVTRVLEWIEPTHEHRRAHKALHYAVEAWAREIGAALIHMREPRGLHMREFVERQGYRPTLLESRVYA